MAGRSSQAVQGVGEGEYSVKERLVADSSLSKAILKDAASGNL